MMEETHQIVDEFCKYGNLTSNDIGQWLTDLDRIITMIIGEELEMKINPEGKD